MKLFVQMFCCLVLSIAGFAQDKGKTVSIIPEPVSVSVHNGTFTLPSTVEIEVGKQPELQTTVQFLKESLSKPTGYAVNVSNAAPNAQIRLQLNNPADASIGNEGYTLSVNSTNITIKANQPAGLFYGAQSLLQLFPKDIESEKTVSNVKWEIPAVEIKDYPRFGWRGLMLDVSRHFFTKEEVKDFIDQMVKYKYNLMHFHLTDDEGWRIEIKGFPKLTEVGAWNVKKVGYFGTFDKPAANEPRDYGGFYTQEDIKELVQYAKERFVNILPEIDVPGHSLAAIASYPELSCTPEAKTYQVRSGEEIMDWSQGHPPIALVDNTLCPANEKVYEFMDKVITQVAELFPFEYMHLGGDECPKNYWAKNPQVKALMKKEGLKTMDEVQSYFTRRMEKIVSSKGRKLIGWDEILQGGGLPKNAAVMSWRGIKGGIEAAKLGHEVVMSPTTFAYLDYMQADPITEPRVYASLRLSKAYEFEPVPEGVDAKFIKGGQANIWSEQMYNMRHLQYMIWPRALATAESVWSPKDKKNWSNFVNKVEDHFERFKAADIKYSTAVYDPIFTATRNAKKDLQIELKTEMEGLDIYYTFDNSFPDNHYPKYEKTLIAPKEAVMLRVITYKGDKPVGRMITMPLDEMKRRADKKQNYP
jgi:hexosaminidase